jgi:glycerol kinase
VFIAGAAVQWLRDALGIIPSLGDSEALAREVDDTAGVYFVPAFVGLAAPHWDPYARGAIVGLTRGTRKAHLVRAALEAICYQTRDVLEAMEHEAGEPVRALRVDGGAASNNLLMQLQADVLGREVQRAAATQTTALGAGFLAGLATGVWSSTADIAALWSADRTFSPMIDTARRNRMYRGWQRAIERARGWVEPAD